ncbi:unnamed protein product [Plutella xylostella]|uniref:(diamondback moth) hypothetical protein n=1 Tax=Plutella xylostella TaxID=51655 RepID=A0A8S4FTT4_PLUXY|nr:unnamed protein product [Plutella xylostella]
MDSLDIDNLSLNAPVATKSLVESVFKSIWPLILSIRKKLNLSTDQEESIKTLKDVFTLCCSQIKKCVLSLFEIFKMEHSQQVFLQESRNCITDRLSWCMDKLSHIDTTLDGLTGAGKPDGDTLDDTLLTTPMYFVNWIDHAFEVLTKLSNVIYKTDYKDSSSLTDSWKNSVVENISELHVCLDELLLSAMTLCKYCLPTDQLIVKARCQVVLRESKALLSELITGDPSSAIKVTIDSLKMPIMPTNVNVLIDVLKDVLYALETNTNTALLALLVHCFSNSMSPVDFLSRHFETGSKGVCSCDVEESDDCPFVKDFDLYNERLLQIGSFAVSCSSDQNRILSLRSGLASLEALDPHLVPALLVSPHSPHARLLAATWRQEAGEVRNSVFLIVDPAAFAEKAKQMMHQHLIPLTSLYSYSPQVTAVIDVGGVVRDFFCVYNEHEPDALTQYERLRPLLGDLNKVLDECKIVSNLLSSDQDVKYDVKKPSNNKPATFEQMLKRLKLLYTIVSRINSLFHPKDNDDQLFVNEICEEPAAPVKNVTHTIFAKNGNTYVNSPRKIAANISRSIFARTANTRTASNRFVLSKLSKRLKMKTREELSFSMQLDELLDSKCEIKGNGDGTREVVNKQLERVRQPSILYNFSPNKNRSSLRKAVLSRHCVPLEAKPRDTFLDSVVTESADLMDENTSLQITEILDQMTNMSHMFTARPAMNSTRITHNPQLQTTTNNNVLSLTVNNETISKRVWNIPVNVSSETPVDDSTASSQPSNFSTLERLNDLNVLESKMNDLMFLQQETSL